MTDELNRLRSMRILILGGGAFVGRAIVEAATSRGHDVTTLTRSSIPQPAENGNLETLFGDRTQPSAFDFALGQQWDAVFDTWSGAPRVVKHSAELLHNHTPYYSYVSSCSVYHGATLPAGISEDFPTVDADPSADRTNYAADKRGAELAILKSFGVEASLFARAGLILGPHEIPGRLPWWLNRIAEGGEILAPGPRNLQVQYIDARDLARWMVSSAEQSLTGVFNSISARGHTNMLEILVNCRAATNSESEFTWVPPQFVLDQGIKPWSEMPIWVDPELSGIYSFDTSKIADSGLSCRPISETVSDTWALMQSGKQPSIQAGPNAPGLDKKKELIALAAWKS